MMGKIYSDALNIIPAELPGQAQYIPPIDIFMLA
jgi:hypothetical protein